MRQRVQTLCSLTLSLLTASARAGSLETLHHFGDNPASRPISNLAIDSRGNIYGAGGGGKNAATVWEVSPATGHPAWTFKVLWNATNPQDGTNASGGVMRDHRGNLFGTAKDGGSGCGAVFEIHKRAETWQHKTLWTFNGGATDGCNPSAALVMDSSGAVYGNTYDGGPDNDGTVFKLTPPAKGSYKWTESILWNFDGTDGAEESTQMNFDTAGNLYGTSLTGGPGGFGTAWELSPPAQGKTAWTLQVIWTHDELPCFIATNGPMVMDKKGNLFGSCQSGGANFDGSVFELTPPAVPGNPWTETTIYNVPNGNVYPTSGLALGKDGVLVGASYSTIYELLPPARGQTQWSERTLWTFDGGDGINPASPPLLLRDGNIFGTALYGGSRNYGTVWKLTP
jgi:uncharacterized repeat protein (TIGR03803 family)